jgi:hypothetical protein
VFSRDLLLVDAALAWNMRCRTSNEVHETASSRYAPNPYSCGNMESQSERVVRISLKFERFAQQKQNGSFTENFGNFPLLSQMNHFKASKILSHL